MTVSGDSSPEGTNARIVFVLSLFAGASSFQMHTYFQLPSGEYSMKTGGKTARALLELYFHPDEGLLAWLLHLRRLLDCVGFARHRDSVSRSARKGVPASR